ncbi:MAG: YggT family protein [Candidatus Omnitrophota bacterium]
MLFSILNLFFQLLIAVLLIRYFIEPYRYYGFGPILVTIVTLTESVLKPIRRLFPQSSLKIQDQMPLFAIVVVIVLRGWCLWILGAAGIPLASVHGVGAQLPLFNALAASFSMGVVFVAEILIALLFASMMVSRHGLYLVGGNAGYACFQQKTFAVFQLAKKILRTENLPALFLLSSAAILACAFFLTIFTNLSFLYGDYEIKRTIVFTLYAICGDLISAYSLVLLLAVLSTWVGADQFSTLIQFVRGMSDPYLNFFRRIFPWARIDFVDLSPIFAFLALNPGLVYLLRVVTNAFLSMIAPEQAPGTIMT